MTNDKPIQLSPNTYVETKTILDILREEDQKQHAKWNDVITFDDFIYGLTKWKEETSTSPSGRHLGVYKALITTHKNKSREFDKDKNLKSALGVEFSDAYINLKLKEWNSFTSHFSSWERENTIDI